MCHDVCIIRPKSVTHEFFGKIVAGSFIYCKMPGLTGFLHVLLDRLLISFHVNESPTFDFFNSFKNNTSLPDSRVPNRFLGIRDFPYLKDGIQHFKLSSKMGVIFRGIVNKNGMQDKAKI